MGWRDIGSIRPTAGLSAKHCSYIKLKYRGLINKRERKKKKNISVRSLQCCFHHFCLWLVNDAAKKPFSQNTEQMVFVSVERSWTAPSSMSNTLFGKTRTCGVLAKFIHVHKNQNMAVKLDIKIIYCLILCFIYAHNSIKKKKKNVAKANAVGNAVLIQFCQ